MSLARQVATEGRPFVSSTLANKAFGRLMELYQARHHAIAKPGTAHLTGDEALLLAAIAQFQQRSLSLLEFVDTSLRTALQDCAASLLVGGIKLPFSSASLAMLQDSDWIVGTTQARNSPIAERKRLASARPVSPLREGTARSRIVGFLSANESASSTKLTSFGATRQYISLLCAEGVIDRVAFGVYALGQRMASAPATKQEL